MGLVGPVCALLLSLAFQGLCSWGNLSDMNAGECEESRWARLLSALVGKWLWGAVVPE